MDSYAARLVLAAVLLAAATFSASLLGEAQAHREADSEPSCIQTTNIVQTQSTASARSGLPCTAFPEEQTPVQKELWQTTYMTALRTSELPAGSEVIVYGTAGEELQQLISEDNGYTGVQPLPPGSYTVWSEELGAAHFLLKENASVEARGGSCWSDGELLHLYKKAALRVECCFKREELPEKKLLLTLTSEDNGSSVERLLSFETAGLLRTLRTAFFTDLEPGTYSLSVNGILWQSIHIIRSPYTVKLDKLP